MIVFDGKEFRKIRKELGYTQVQFAEKIGCGVETIKKWEYGIGEPSVKKSNILLPFLYKHGIDVQRLYKEVDREQEHKARRKSEYILDGEKLKKRRKKCGYLQKDIAKLLEVNPFTVSKWELETTSCSEKNIRELTLILHCKIQDLCKDTKDSI